MPRSWYDYHANSLGEDPTEEDITRRKLYLSILADKKPYFMRYIYPDLMKQYNTYLANTNAKCGMLFRMPVDELIATPEDQLSEDQRQFLHYYYNRMPVSLEDSVMNRICRKVEQALSVDLRVFMGRSQFDHNILKQDIDYAVSQRMQIQQLYKQYKQALKELLAKTTNGSDDEEKKRGAQEMLKRQFRIDALSVCSDAQQLCSIMVDLCYVRESSKHFVWDICGTEMLDNLFSAGGYTLTYPAKVPNGELSFRGQQYTMVSKECNT